MPTGIEEMPVCWHAMTVPAAPPRLTLNDEELHHPDPAVRFARRTIQIIQTQGTGERLALIDKALPHAALDMMLSELSQPARSTPCAVSAETGLALWRVARELAHFRRDAHISERFGLAGSRCHLALNLDPHTLDRESVQAGKHFHAHLILFRAEEIAARRAAVPLKDIHDPRLRRQALDPLAFLGAALIYHALHDLSAPPGIELLAPDPAAVVAGRRPLGCLWHLADWSALDAAAFSGFVRDIERRLTGLAADLLEAFTERRHAPEPWRRWPLLQIKRIQANLDRLDLGPELVHSLMHLARRLRDLPTPVIERLRQGSASTRKHLMCLNQPSWTLSISEADAGATSEPELLMRLEARLFSGIGSAGLLGMDGVPSVRICRGHGVTNEASWRARADCQRAFARWVYDKLGHLSDIHIEPPRRYLDAGLGWQRG